MWPTCLTGSHSQPLVWQLHCSQYECFVLLLCSIPGTLLQFPGDGVLVGWQDVVGDMVLSHGLFCFSCRKQWLAGLLGPPHEILQLQSHQGAPEGRRCFGLTSFTCMESALGAVWVPLSSGPGVCYVGCPCSVPSGAWQLAFLCWQMSPRQAQLGGHPHWEGGFCTDWGCSQATFACELV